MKAKFTLTVISMLFVLLAFSQENTTITGTIKDENKQPLPGATVVVKGTTIGTATDNNGVYTLQVPADAKALVVSFVGFENKEIEIKPGQNYSVNLASSDISLNQVVVSVSRRKEKLLDAPASISVVGLDKLERNIVTTPVDQLKTTPGVDVMRTGLVSSNVVIRGFNNIFSGAVLNVIDNRIGSVPSLRVNAYQLVPTSTLDYEKIEVVRGPASALYGPNASSGVVHIMTKSPLEQEKKFETTVAMTGGFTVLDKSYQQFNNGSPISGNIVNPEIRHSGKLFDGKFGYKISGGYFQGQDYPNYDPREPYTGDSLVFGTVRNGQIFSPDTLKKYTHTDINGNTVVDSAQLDIRRFNKDFSIRKWNIDARMDIQPIKDITITFNGGIASAHNIELTGLGAGQAGGDKGGWSYWYFQTRFRWKKLFLQYFINSSDAGKTYLIPQLSDASRNDYNSTSPPTAYPVQLLVDKSKLHVFQAQHSVSFLENKINLVYGIDALLTRPNTEGTINGRFESVAKLNQVGGYVQGDYAPVKWFKLVAAIRIDYNSIINNVAASPRGALVFKPADNHNIRITYNRAFDSPNTLNQFLDLSNGLIPNGINVRGIGNPYGWNYRYDQNSNVVQFKTAPYGQPEGQWVTFNDKSINAASFEQMYGLLLNGLKAGRDPGTAAALENLMGFAFDGIRGQSGTVANAEQLSIDFAKFAQTKDFAGSIQKAENFKNLKRINNQYTQTLELGYKGLIAKKLSIDVDVYWSHISNYVSALQSASGAVTFDYKSYLGEKAPGGKLYDNLHRDLDGFGSTAEAGLSALNNNPGLQNPSIVAPDSTTVWDELVVLMNQVPIGTITPDDPKYVNSDFILTYKNLGNLDIFGIDFGFQYNIYEDAYHSVSAGGSLSWVDKDQLVLSTGEAVPLNATKVKAAVIFDHTLKKSGFGYGLTFRYQRGYDANSAIYVGHVDPAYLLDARVSYRPSWYKGLLLSINVNNVTNYQWASFPGTPKMGAQFFARAQVTF